MISRLPWLARIVAALALAFAVWSGPSVAHAEEGEPAGWATERATARVVVGRAVLYYEPHLHDEAMDLARSLPGLWSEVEQSMSRDLDDRMQIWFFDHAGRVAEASDMPKWVAGVAHSSTGEIMIARHGPDGAPTNLESLLKHELAHVALHRATGGAKVPRWFHEGMAESLEGGISFSRSQTLATAVFGRGVPDFDTLEKMFYSDGQDAAAAYAASRDFINFLRDHDGDGKKLKQLLDEMRRGHGFKASFIRAYGMGLEELGSQWREGLPARFIWYPLLAGGTLPFALVFPLVFVAWARRRRRYRAGLARLEAEELAVKERLSLSAKD